MYQTTLQKPTPVLSKNQSEQYFFGKIYNENCLETIQKLPSNFIDLIVTSPPYDNMRSYEGNTFFQFKEIASKLFRVMKIGGVIVGVVGDQTKNGNESGTSFKQALFF